MSTKAKSESRQTTETTTQTVNEDNRVVGEEGSVTLGKGAGIVIQDEFSENVRDAFSELVDLGRGAGQIIADISKRGAESAEKALDTVARTIKETQVLTTNQTTAGLLTTSANIQSSQNTLDKIIPIAVMGILAIVGIQLLRR